VVRRGLRLHRAPWFPCAYTPHITAPKVGNGGFSLRKVESCLRVLDAPALGRTYWVDPDEYWENFRDGAPVHRRLANLPRKYLKRFYAFNSPRRVISRALDHPTIVIEDEFWSNRAPLLYPPFTVAPVDDGLRFAFEAEPRMCFELTATSCPSAATLGTSRPGVLGAVPRGRAAPWRTPRVACKPPGLRVTLPTFRPPTSGA
jgi:hypothetical protein